MKQALIEKKKTQQENNQEKTAEYQASRSTSKNQDVGMA
jgi:hypothetical protein